MHIFYRLIFVAMAFAACTPGEEKKVTEMKKSFNDFLDAYYEERLKLYPMEATQIGDNRYNNLLPNDISEGFRSDLKAFYSRYQSELIDLSRATLFLHRKK